MSTAPKTQTEPAVEISLTDADKAAVAAVCGLRNRRIVALYEGVWVYDPAHRAFDPITLIGLDHPDSEPHPTVEVVVATRSGRIEAHRYRHATAAEFLAACHAAANATPPQGTAAA